MQKPECGIKAINIGARDWNWLLIPHSRFCFTPPYAGRVSVWVLFIQTPRKRLRVGFVKQVGVMHA